MFPCWNWRPKDCRGSASVMAWMTLIFSEKGRPFGAWTAECGVGGIDKKN